MPLPRPLTALLVALSLAGCAPPETSAVGTYPVESVVDGDTIRVSIDGDSHRVRILGIDAPEVEPPEACSAEATTHLEQLVDGKPVTLVRSAEAPARDRYDRILAYVEADSGDAGLSLLEAGLVAPYRAQEHERQRAYEAAAKSAESPACAR